MGIHLKFDVAWAYYNNVEMEHAQIVMKELGITYQQATPQTMGDCWWFWNCENIPETLPKYLEYIDLKPVECIGHGLSKEDAEMILKYKS